ncbi:NADH-quinone oxidoreductase subunit NuoE [Mycobacterium sp. M1]|uniref:NADH-quinone oxidoreductase subunit NuoE n=1 Tax=Mycolicibacter acidiphilus TaxID=2835306 RepID=A0ABS5RHE8_9MYCO|nr:NADH-quinone oxidoreductase subunit NuoE [Mycolicibacter acidiphilus]MBS9533696.1 NADH-quinone oxidoreductase subunit NuoE [Mycolicibacter acidiphilus]
MNGARKFIQLGRPPQEAGQFNYPGAPQSYPPEVKERLSADAQQIIARYPQRRSALQPLLHLVQSHDSYVTPAGLAFVAELLELTGAELAAVASFYSMYRRKPTGDYLVGVCTNTLCAVMGGDAIHDTLKEHLQIGDDDTTADGKVTLERIECNAACDCAPVVMVNWEFFDQQSPESARALVDSLRAGEEVRPTRGMPLETFKETARVLAGFFDERPDDGQGGPAGPTLAGLQFAHEHQMAAPDAPAAEGGAAK